MKACTLMRTRACAGPEDEKECRAAQDATGNETYNEATSACKCTRNFEGSLGSCVACTGGKMSGNGATCECPDAMPIDNAGMCEASRQGTCTSHLSSYDSITNRCVCP